MLANKQNQRKNPDPMAVMHISSAYGHSGVLTAVHGLDVFSKLADSPATDKSGPMLAAKIGINQLTRTPAVRADSAKEVADWVAEIGFKDLSFGSLPGPFTLMQGTKR